jgi:rsbT co-antagonist protein RsbR
MNVLSRRPRATRPLATTLASAFSALSAVVLLISSILQIVFNLQAQQAIVASQQQLIAQGAARAVSAFIQEKLSVLETAVRLVDLVGGSADQQQQILDSLLGAQPSFRHLVTLNVQGEELARSSRISQTALDQFSAQLSPDLVAQIAAEAEYISAISIDDVTSEPLIVMAIPVTNALGDVQGVLVAEVNLKFMWDLVDQITVGEGGSAYVVDRQGALIAFSDTARVLRGENVSQIQAVSAFINQEGSAGVTSVQSYSGILGERVVGTYVALGEPDWAVVTELPWEEAYQGVLWQGISSIVITLAIVVLAGFLGTLLARRLARPLVSLTGAATRIASGEMDLQAQLDGPHEVASLAAAFNNMTAQLRQTLESLEQRVADRTLDLQRALGEVEARAQTQAHLLAENERQRETIREMSVPVLPVMDSTLVMPLVGALDTERIHLLQEQALRAIERARARTLILDITGVPIVDSQVAQGLIMVVQSARLLGTGVLLVGIRPEVAQTIVGLGLSLEGLQTYSDLQSALSRRAGGSR